MAEGPNRGEDPTSSTSSTRMRMDTARFTSPLPEQHSPRRRTCRTQTTGAQCAGAGSSCAWSMRAACNGGADTVNICSAKQSLFSGSEGRNGPAASRGGFVNNWCPPEARNNNRNIATAASGLSPGHRPRVTAAIFVQEEQNSSTSQNKRDLSSTGTQGTVQAAPSHTQVSEGQDLQTGNSNQTSRQDLMESLDSSGPEYHRPLNVEGEMFVCSVSGNRFQTSV
uniref:uncharacterized protein isoform X2 n=1 Tax=Pristiophorus japonicus TaxID=55135 RepID=UPI00398E3422